MRQRPLFGPEDFQAEAIELLSLLPHTEDRDFYLAQGMTAELFRLLELVADALEAGEFIGQARVEAELLLANANTED